MKIVFNNHTLKWEEMPDPENAGATDIRSKYRNLPSKERHWKLITDYWKRQVDLLWYQDVFTDEEKENLRNMIESEDHENIKVAVEVIKNTGKYIEQFKEDG